MLWAAAGSPVGSWGRCVSAHIILTDTSPPRSGTRGYWMRGDGAEDGGGWGQATVQPSMGVAPPQGL